MAYEGDFLVVAPEITGDARGCAHAEVAGSADRERGRTFGDEPGDLFLTDRRTHGRAASLTAVDGVRVSRQQCTLDQNESSLKSLLK